MLRSRFTPASTRRLRMARRRRVLVLAMTLSFAIFVSVANATAEDLATGPGAPTNEVVVVMPTVEAPPVAVPVPAPTPAPAVASTPAPAPVADEAPVVELEPVPVAPNPAAEEAELALEQDAPVAPVDPPALGEQSLAAEETDGQPLAMAPKPAPVVKVAARVAVKAIISCPGTSVCRVSLVGGVYQVSVSDKVLVCHATSGLASTGFGFNVITPNSDSIAFPNRASNDHGAHTKTNFWTTDHTAGDIVEPFTYFTGDVNANGVIDAGEVATFPGTGLGTDGGADVSWSTIFGQAAGLTGAAILANGCRPPGAAVPLGCPAGTTDFNPPALDCRPPKPPVADSAATVCHAGVVGGFDVYQPQVWTIVAGDIAASHGADINDIIPAFDYATEPTWNGSEWEAQTARFEGRNLGLFTRNMTFPVVGIITVTLNGANALASGTCATTPPAPRPDVLPTPVTMCHALNIGGFDTYVRLVSDSNAVLAAGGHDSEPFDVIPAFRYTVGHSFDATTNSWTKIELPYAGKNLGAFTRTMNVSGAGVVTRSLVGTSMLAGNCAEPALPRRPDVQPVLVTMCHAMTVDGRDSYSLINGTNDTVLAAGGHDADAFDVIPPFTYTTGYTYDLVTNAWIAQTAAYAGKNLGDFTRTLNLSTGSAIVTLNGSAMLASGTCAIPAQPVAADGTPPPTVVGEQSLPGGGDSPMVEAAGEVEVEADAAAEPTIMADAEPAAEETAADGDDALPFTGLQLGALVFIALGSIGGGVLLHAVRRRRRDEPAPAR